MIESFPFKQIGSSLDTADFSLFSSSYKGIVQSRIPSCDEVYFVESSQNSPKLFTDPRKGTELLGAVQRLLAGEVKCEVVYNTILLSFALQEASPLVAVIGGVDSFITERATEDWLEERQAIIFSDFLAVKRAYRDPETGLLNSDHLFSLLRSPERQESVELLLVELPPRLRTLKNVFRNGQKAAAALRLYAQGRYLLHHLGQSIFALVGAGRSVSTGEQFSAKLVLFLKKEGFYKAHAGSSLRDDSDDGSNSPFQILDEAWTALQVAGNRGPFSFCEYGQLVNWRSHPLRSHADAVVKSYRRLSRRDERFCLVKFYIPCDVETDQQAIDSLLLTGSSVSLGFDRGWIAYLPDAEIDQGIELARDGIAKLLRQYPDCGVYAGVSCYPFEEGARMETLQNVQKALLHAAFFGAGYVAQFDAVSSNVSGDVYFGEGDLPQAVKEYKRGLKTDPTDVNLLNSLGVAYAMLNKSASAKEAFHRVVDLDAGNYMALYNLGLGAKAQGDLLSAVAHLETALESIGETPEDNDLVCELELQLGKLHCQLGNYQTCLTFFEKWQEKVSPQQRELINKFMGEAYLGIGQAGLAMNFLQRAHQTNEYDFETLSLLGTAIGEAGEGDDIALSLCSKSVDLAPNDLRVRLRLARIQSRVGSYKEALANLSKCKGRGVDITELQLLKAEINLKLSDSRKVKFWAKKVLQRTEKGSKHFCMAEALLESIQ